MWMTLRKRCIFAMFVQVVVSGHAAKRTANTKLPLAGFGQVTQLGDGGFLQGKDAADGTGGGFNIERKPKKKPVKQKFRSRARPGRHGAVSERVTKIFKKMMDSLGVRNHPHAELAARGGMTQEEKNKKLAALGGAQAFQCCVNYDENEGKVMMIAMTPDCAEPYKELKVKSKQFVCTMEFLANTAKAAKTMSAEDLIRTFYKDREAFLTPEMKKVIKDIEKEAEEQYRLKLVEDTKDDEMREFEKFDLDKNKVITFEEFRQAANNHGHAAGEAANNQGHAAGEAANNQGHAAGEAANNQGHAAGETANHSGYAAPGEENKHEPAAVLTPETMKPKEDSKTQEELNKKECSIETMETKEGCCPQEDPCPACNKQNCSKSDSESDSEFECREKRYEPDPNTTKNKTTVSWKKIYECWTNYCRVYNQRNNNELKEKNPEEEKGKTNKEKQCDFDKETRTCLCMRGPHRGICTEKDGRGCAFWQQFLPECDKKEQSFEGKQKCHRHHAVQAHTHCADRPWGVEQNSCYGQNWSPYKGDAKGYEKWEDPYEEELKRQEELKQQEDRRKADLVKMQEEERKMIENQKEIDRQKDENARKLAEQQERVDRENRIKDELKRQEELKQQEQKRKEIERKNKEEEGRKEEIVVSGDDLGGDKKGLGDYCENLLDDDTIRRRQSCLRFGNSKECMQKEKDTRKIECIKELDKVAQKCENEANGAGPAFSKAACTNYYTYMLSVYSEYSRNPPALQTWCEGDRGCKCRPKERQSESIGPCGKENSNYTNYCRCNTEMNKIEVCENVCAPPSMTDCLATSQESTDCFKGPALKAYIEEGKKIDYYGDDDDED